jgi:hypothetical protein
MSAFTAGQKIRASDLNRACPTELEQECTADYTITGAYGDVTGATITFTTSVTNAVVIIQGDFDFRLTATGTGYCYGAVMIDGVRHARQRLFLFQSTETREGSPLRIKATLAAAGSHTIKLQAKKDSVGTALFCANSTYLALTVYGV